MKPKPVEPKRALFTSFDDYFDAMIQYHLELSQQDPSFTHSSDQSSCGKIRLPEGRKAWHARLNSFMSEHVQ